MSAAALAWYLIRTKPGKEQYLHRELSRRLPETFMPMLETRSRRQTISLVPLFPQYLFARLELAVHYFEIRYMLGVVGFISTSGEPLAVAQTIVDDFDAIFDGYLSGSKQRCAPYHYCRGMRHAPSCGRGKRRNLAGRSSGPRSRRYNFRRQPRATLAVDESMSEDASA